MKLVSFEKQGSILAVYGQLEMARNLIAGQRSSVYVPDRKPDERLSPVDKITMAIHDLQQHVLLQLEDKP